MQPGRLYIFSTILAGSLIFTECGLLRGIFHTLFGRGKEDKPRTTFHRDCDEVFLASRSQTKSKVSVASLWNMIPSWDLDSPCILKSLLNFDIIVRFLDLVDKLIYPCMDLHPWLLECRPNTTFNRFSSENGYSLALEWPCLQSANNAEDFYSMLGEVYKLLNPCARNAPKLDLEQKPVKELELHTSLSLWMYALWGFWWYFISRQVVFHLLQSMNSDEDIPSTIYDKGMLFQGTFNKSKPTTILIHGFFNAKMSNMEHLFRIAYFGDEIRADEVQNNIIVVEWSSLSHETYLITRWRLILVSRQVAAFITRLIAEYGVSLNSIHIIGHSLGAHVAGITGNLLAEYAEDKKNGLIGRITGLDPASPGFRILPSKMKINKNSAKFVDIIHTSSYTFGSAEALGDVDIYVNSGYPTQPGCGLGGLLGISVSGILDFDIVCSHSRAIFYYTEAIVFRNAFKAQKCSSFISFQLGLCRNQSIIYLGEFTRNTARGSYYLSTNSKPPFGLGNFGI